MVKLWHFLLNVISQSESDTTLALMVYKVQRCCPTTRFHVVAGLHMNPVISRKHCISQEQDTPCSSSRVQLERWAAMLWSRGTILLHALLKNPGSDLPKVCLVPAVDGIGCILSQWWPVQIYSISLNEGVMALLCANRARLISITKCCRLVNSFSFSADYIKTWNNTTKRVTHFAFA